MVQQQEEVALMASWTDCGTVWPWFCSSSNDFSDNHVEYINVCWSLTVMFWSSTLFLPFFLFCFVKIKSTNKVCKRKERNSWELQEALDRQEESCAVCFEGERGGSRITGRHEKAKARHEDSKTRQSRHTSSLCLWSLFSPALVLFLHSLSEITPRGAWGWNALAWLPPGSGFALEEQDPEPRQIKHQELVNTCGP